MCTVAGGRLRLPRQITGWRAMQVLSSVRAARAAREAAAAPRRRARPGTKSNYMPGIHHLSFDARCRRKRIAIANLLQRRSGCFKGTLLAVLRSLIVKARRLL